LFTVVQFADDSVHPAAPWVDRNDHVVHMDNGALRYLNLVNDKEQYPAARCGMGKCIYMYGCTLSSSAKSMNNVNMVVRERTAVDVVNASILLLKLEAKRYKEHRIKAWVWNNVLTSHGKKLCDESFGKVNFRQYQIYVEMVDYTFKCRV
jgi:hypothetical protein